MRKSHFLRVSSILSMLCGLVRIAFGFMMINYFSTVLTFGVGRDTIGFANAAAAVLLLGGLTEIVCGFLGAMNWEEPLRAKTVAVWGAVSLAVGLLGNFMQIGTGYGTSYVTWATGLIIPGVFFAAALIFALKSKKN